MPAGGDDLRRGTASQVADDHDRGRRAGARPCTPTTAPSAESTGSQASSPGREARRTRPRREVLHEDLRALAGGGADQRRERDPPPVGREPRLGGVAGPRRRPHALQRAGAHVAHDDVGARLRALGVLVGLEGDEAAVARDRRVVRRPRGRARRVARGPDPARAEVADVHAHLPVALGEVQVAVRGLERHPAPVLGHRRVVVGARQALGAAREQRRRPRPGRGPSPRSRRASWRSSSLAS